MTQQPICYAITSSALRLLHAIVDSTSNRTDIDPCWFNWSAGKPQGHAHDFHRLQQLEDEWARSEFAAWEVKARALDLKTCIVFTSEDDGLIYQKLDLMDDWSDGLAEKDQLSDDLELLLVNENDKASQYSILQRLGALDKSLRIGFSELRGGGGHDLADVGYADYSPRHWWMLADAYCTWLKVLKEHASSPMVKALRPQVYDLTDWNEYSQGNNNPELTALDHKATVESFFTTFRYHPAKQRFILHALHNGLGTLDKPWTTKSLQEAGFQNCKIEEWPLGSALANTDEAKKSMGAGHKLKAIYPTAQLPMCGIAVMSDNTLIPYGCFAHLENPWAWDGNGVVRNAVAQQHQARRQLWLESIVDWFLEHAGVGAPNMIAAGAAHRQVPRKSIATHTQASKMSPSKWRQSYRNGLEVSFELLVETDPSTQKSIAMLTAKSTQPTDFSGFSTLAIPPIDGVIYRFNPLPVSADENVANWTFEIDLPAGELQNHLIDKGRIEVC